MPNRSGSPAIVGTGGRCARGVVFLVLLAVAACRERSAESVVQASGQQHQQQQEVPAPPEFAALRVPPADVAGLQTYEIVETLMERCGVGSACDDSHTVVVEHMEADGTETTSGFRRD